MLKCTALQLKESQDTLTYSNSLGIEFVLENNTPSPRTKFPVLFFKVYIYCIGKNSGESRGPFTLFSCVPN